MKTRIQTILETVENLMEYYAPDHIYKFDRSKIPVYDYISRQPVQRRPRVPSEPGKRPYPRLPPSVRPGAGDGFDKVPYNPKRPGFEPYRPEPTPDIGPYKPFPKIPSTPKRPGIGIEPRWPRIGIEQEISDAERKRRSEQFIRAEDRPAGAYPPTKSTGNISRTPYT